MSIEAWVTTPAAVYLAHLERSEASPFRSFAVSRRRGAEPGTGSLQHHLDNDLTRDGTLLADGNLVWMRYRGKTMVWVIEERTAVLDENEHATDWVHVTGRGVKQLLADRTIWPTGFSETALNPAVWDAGAWKTTLDGSAASGQKVVPVTSTTGAVVNDPVQLTGGGNTELGIIASIVAGVSVTLVDNLASTYAAGARIASAAKQWRRFVNRAAGEMLWDLISESNPRFPAQITRGTVETTGADGWTQDFRFDTLLDVVSDVVATHGEIDMDGLTFSYRNAPGVDRRATVIFEEGADLLKVERTISDRDTITWAVAEGVGEGVTAKLAVAKDTTAVRRREGYVDAKDAGNVPLVQLRANATIAESKKADSIALDVDESRFRVFEDFDLHDTVRAIAPSRGIDAAAVIVGISIGEDGDEKVAVQLDVNTPRQEALLRIEEGAKSIGRSVGIRNRMPQGNYVPYSFGGGGIFDSGSPMYVFVKIPDRVKLIIEAQVTLAFRQFLAPATAASSGGGSTSGASSASSSGASSASSSAAGQHSHLIGQHNAAGPGGYALRRYDGASINFDLATSSAVNLSTLNEDVGGGSGHSHTIAHTHGIAHDHSTPNHTHGLTYGTFEEAMPASHSVALRVYERVAGAWTLRGTFAGLTGDLEDVDLTAVMVGPGDWRLTVQSDGGQPQGGRLGCDVYGAITGAIQSE